MAKKERLEDLGRLQEKLKSIVESRLLEFCNSKHDFETWSKNYPELYDAHVAVRFLKEHLLECYEIAIGDEE